MLLSLSVEPGLNAVGAVATEKSTAVKACVKQSIYLYKLSFGDLKEWIQLSIYAVKSSKKKRNSFLEGKINTLSSTFCGSRGILDFPTVTTQSVVSFGMGSIGPISQETVQTQRLFCGWII